MSTRTYQRHHRSSRPATASRGARPRWGAWWTENKQVHLFVAKFVATVAVFHVLTRLPVYDGLLPFYLHAVASVARFLSHCLGESGEVVGATLRSPAYAVTVSPACSAVELAGFIVAAVVAFPSRISAKISGALLGVVLVALLNIIRVTSLFLVGLHAPAAFDLVHEDLWAVMFILIATLFVAMWVAHVHRQSSRPVTTETHA